MSILLIFFILFLFFIFMIYLAIVLLDKLQLKRLRRKYNAEEDNSRRPEPGGEIQPRREYPKLIPSPAIKIDRTKQELRKSIESDEGDEQPERRGIFQHRVPVSAGENQQEPGRTAKHKGLIGKLRRRRTRTISGY